MVAFTPQQKQRDCAQELSGPGENRRRGVRYWSNMSVCSDWLARGANDGGGLARKNRAPKTAAPPPLGARTDPAQKQRRAHKK
jgi:hypothetical protein